MENHYLSAERLKELEKELEGLKTTSRLEVAEHFKRAKEYGDLSENAEFVEAREEQTQLESRIFELEELLKRAVIIKKTSGSGLVEVGSKISVKKGGTTLQYTIVGSNESRPEEGKISNESPIGRAFLGHKVGDSVTVTTPSGQTAYQITKIE